VQWLGQSAFNLTRPTGTVVLIDAFLAKNPKHAACATRRDLKPQFAIPMHDGTNPRRKGAPEQDVRALGRTDTKVLALLPGEQVPF
jgi:L-ascorbate metabolism protein UlaG (beta-lactamase superfamily)